MRDKMKDDFLDYGNTLKKAIWDSDELNNLLRTKYKDAIQGFDTSIQDDLILGGQLRKLFVDPHCIHKLLDTIKLSIILDQDDGKTSKFKRGVRGLIRVADAKNSKQLFGNIKVVRLLSRIVKHSLRRICSTKDRNNHLDDLQRFCNFIITLLLKVEDRTVEQNLIWALGYSLTVSRIQLSEICQEKLTDYNHSTLERSEALDFLRKQIVQRNDFKNVNNDQLHLKNLDSNLVVHLDSKIRPSRKKLQRKTNNYSGAQVTRTQQTVAVQFEQLESEQAHVALMDISESLKRNKLSISRSFNTESIPAPKSVAGDDRSWYRTTHYEIENLHSLALSGKTIRNDDKDNYLVDKLFGSHYGLLNDWAEGNIKITNIFRIISKKQEITNRTIDRIFVGLCKDFGNAKYFNPSQLNKLRVNILHAVYNCSLRRKSILTRERLKIIEQYSTAESDLQKIAWLILLYSGEDESSYKKLFKTALVELSNKGEWNKSIHNINQQTKIEKRCKELFVPEVVTFLTQRVVDAKLEMEIRIGCCNIISNLLSESVSPSLDNQSLLSLAKILENSSSITSTNELCSEILVSILLSLQKRKSFAVDPEINKVLEILLQIDESVSENLSSLIILSLAFVSKTISIPKLENIAYKLVCADVIVGEGSEIRFEKPSEDTSGCTTVASVVSQIFLNSVRNGADLKLASIDKLIKSINSSDKNARIISAECLYLDSLGDCWEIPEELLMDYSKFCDDSVVNVRIHIMAAYVNRLARMQKKIFFSHLEIMPRIYNHEPIFLDGRDFADELNKAVLQTLFVATLYGHQFNDEILRLLECIFLLGKDQQYEALCIVESYCRKGNDLPGSTVNAIENVLGSSEYADLALTVSKRCIMNGLKVSQKVLQLLVDDFFLGEDPKSRVRSFELLNLANDNQEFIPQTYLELELERSALLISNGFHQQKSLEFIQQCVKNGSNLSIQCFWALKYVLGNIDVLDKVISILVFASENRQIVPEEIIVKVCCMFDYKISVDCQTLMIKLFSAATRNNQILPHIVISKLQGNLENNFDEIMPIFVTHVLKGEILCQETITAIFNKLMAFGDDELKLEKTVNYFSFIPSVIKLHSNIDSILIQNILKRMMFSTETTLISNALEVFQNHPSIRPFFNENEVDDLLEFWNSCKNSDIKHKLLNVFGLCNLNPRQNILYQFANTKYLSVSSFLQQLEILFQKYPDAIIHDHIYQEIHAALESDMTDDVKLEILTTLYSSQKANHLPVYILEKVSQILFESIKHKNLETRRNRRVISEDDMEIILSEADLNPISNVCCLLLSRYLLKGNLVSTTVIYNLYNPIFIQNLGISESVQTVLEYLLHLIEKVQTIPDEIHCFLRASSNALDDTSKISDLNLQLKDGVKITQKVVKKLVDSAVRSFHNWDLLKIYGDCFLTLLATENNDLSRFYKNISNCFENAILGFKTNPIHSNIIRGYLIILQNQLCPILPKGQEAISTLLELSSNEDIPLASDDLCLIIECLIAARTFLTSENFKNSQSLLEDFLDSSDSTIKRLCFCGLKDNWLEGNYSTYFETWCMETLKFFTSEVDLQFSLDQSMSIDNLLFLEALVTVKTIDLGNIKSSSSIADCTQVTLISDLIWRFDRDPIQCIDLFQTIKEIEMMEEFSTSAQVVTIFKLLLSAYDHEPCLFEDMKCLLESIKLCKYNSVVQILKKKQKNWTRSIFQLALTEKVQEKLSSLSPMEEIPQIIDVLLSKIGYQSSNDLLHKMPSNFYARDLKKLTNLFKEETCVSMCISNVDSSLTMEDLTQNLEREFLIKDLPPTFSDLKSIKNIVKEELKFGIQFTLLKEILIILRGVDEPIFNFPETFANILRLIYRFELNNDSLAKIKTVLSNFPVSQWLKECNNVSISSKFSSVRKLKDLFAITGEVLDLNILHLSPERISELERCLLEIRSESFMSCVILQKVRPISKFGIEDIKLWKNKLNPPFSSDYMISEVVAIIKQAIVLIHNFHLTDLQILSILIALRNKGKGILQQVVTGAGKSAIIRVLAIVKALEGKTVDIVTSSPVLAERDTKESVKLYALFGLTVDHNGDKSIYIQGPKECYQKNILYGDASQYQFDILRDEYSCLGTMKGRKCEMVIVDEVDTMLIDDSSKIARLSSTIAGMDQLQSIYHFLWERVVTLQSRMISIGEKMYYGNGTITVDDDKTFIETCDDGLNISKVDIMEMITKVGNLDGVCEEIEDDIYEFVSNHLKDYLKALTGISVEPCFSIDKKDQISIPSNLKEFVVAQIPRWVQNVLTAYEYEENVHYVIQDGNIKPVDFQTTGIVQSSTNWSDGLHQCLQIKHSLQMTSETLTTNFISNMSFFKRYGANLFGFSGTLGSPTARNILKQIYNVDLIIMPQLYYKQFLEYETKIAETYRQWLQFIVSSCSFESHNGRGVLVICETIKHAKDIASQLRKVLREDCVKLYTMNNSNQEKDVERVSPGDVVVATNLAGRGTDIKTNEIECNGGLHVCLTFLPRNLRVEEQALGRTARQGNRGTSQMILNVNDLSDFCFVVNIFQNENQLLTNLRDIRNEVESKVLEEFMATTYPAISEKDELFRKFCSLLQGCRKKLREERGFWTKAKDNVKNVFTDVLPSVYEISIICAIEERWAMFLRAIDESGAKPDTYLKMYNESISNNIESQFSKNPKNVIKSPFHAITIANDLIKHESRFNNNFDDAMAHYNLAIELDSEFTAAAFIGKAWCLLQAKTNFIGSQSFDNGYKTEALTYLNKALELLHNEMSRINAVHCVLEQRIERSDSELGTQLTLKTNILGCCINSVKVMISTIQKSQRLVDIKGLQFVSNGTELESSTKFCGILRHDLENEIEGFNQYEIVFHDLTVLQDTITKDQAIELIKNHKNQSKNVVIDVFDTCSESLSSLFSVDLKFKSISKEVALNTLNQKKSYLFSSKVDIEIFSEVGKETVRRDIEVKDAISLIEKISDFANCNLTVPKGNKFYKTLSKFDSKMDLHFEEINLQTTIQLLVSTFCSPTVTLMCVGSPKDLHSLCSKMEIEQVFKNTVESDKKKFKTIKSLTSTIISDKVESIEFHKISLQNAIDFCQMADKENFEVLLNLEMLSVKVDNTSKLLNSNENFYSLDINIKMRANFHCWDSNICEDIISDLRENHLDFVVRFQNLNYGDVKQLISSNIIVEEEIEVSEIKLLASLFLKENILTNPEVQEFVSRGLQYILEIREKSFIPWTSILGVCALAGIQMLVGGILVASGFGATVGMGLITEGVADLFTAYRAYSSRSFSWEDYGKQKAVSLVISAVSMGWRAIKDAGKGVNVVSQGIVNESLEQAGTKLVVGGKTVAHTLKQSAKSLKSSAAKYICVSVAEAGAREALNNVVSALTNFTLENFRSSISQNIENQVRKKMHGIEMDIILNRMFALQVFFDIDTVQMVERMIQQTESDSVLRKQWDSIGLPLCKGILSDPKYLGSKFSMTLRIVGTLHGISEIVFIVNKICLKVKDKLIQFEQEKFSLFQIFHIGCKIPRDESQKLAEFIYANREQLMIPGGSGKITCDLLLPQKQKILESSVLSKSSVTEIERFFKSFSKQVNASYEDNYFCVIDKITQFITNEIIRVTDRQLISPWSTHLVGQFVNNISATLQHKYLVNKKNDKTESDKNAPKNTIASEIKSAAQEFTVAHSQCDDIVNAEKGPSNTDNLRVSKDEKLKDHADKVKAGAPAGILEMFHLAKPKGLDIKLVDSENYMPSDDEKAKGVHIIVYKEGSVGADGTKSVGHYQLKDSVTGELIDFSGDSVGENDCGYAILGKLSGKSIEQLRSSMASNLLSPEYAKSLNNALSAERWVESRYPKEANAFLFKGGLKKKDPTEQYPGGIPQLNRNSSLIKKVEKALANELDKYFKRNHMKGHEKTDYVVGIVEVTVKEENGEKTYIVWSLSGSNVNDPLLTSFDPFKGDNKRFKTTDIICASSVSIEDIRNEKHGGKEARACAAPKALIKVDIDLIPLMQPKQHARIRMTEYSFSNTKQPSGYSGIIGQTVDSCSLCQNCLPRIINAMKSHDNEKVHINSEKVWKDTVR